MITQNIASLFGYKHVSDFIRVYETEAERWAKQVPLNYEFRADRAYEYYADRLVNEKAKEYRPIQTDVATSPIMTYSETTGSEKTKIVTYEIEFVGMKEIFALKPIDNIDSYEKLQVTLHFNSSRIIPDSCFTYHQGLIKFNFDTKCYDYDSAKKKALEYSNSIMSLFQITLKSLNESLLQLPSSIKKVTKSIIMARLKEMYDRDTENKKLNG